MNTKAEAHQDARLSPTIPWYVFSDAKIDNLEEVMDTNGVVAVIPSHGEFLWLTKDPLMAKRREARQLLVLPYKGGKQKIAEADGIINTVISTSDPIKCIWVQVESVLSFWGNVYLSN